MMAQCGFHILSEIGSEICVFKNIFTDIGDEQSIKQSLSTFSSHMKNLIYIMENIDDNSLVLLDEIGSGTDFAEGSALAISILEYLQSKKSKTIATTHYSELKFYGTDTKGVLNANVKFDLNKENSNGLGLYIVSNILNNYNIEYKTLQDEEFFIFKIKIFS